MRIQKPTREGKRKQLSPWVSKEIRRRVKELAQDYGVSRSFVISVALAEQFGIKNQELYDVPVVGEVRHRKASKGNVLTMSSYSRKGKRAV